MKRRKYKKKQSIEEELLLHTCVIQHSDFIFCFVKLYLWNDQNLVLQQYILHPNIPTS